MCIDGLAEGYAPVRNTGGLLKSTRRTATRVLVVLAPFAYTMNGSTIART